MLVVDKYYQVIEKDVNKVSSLWRVIHLGALLIASMANFSSVIFDIKIRNAFGDRCILYSELHFTDHEPAQYSNVGNFTMNKTFYNAITKYGDYQICSYTILLNLACFILAVILILCIAIVSISKSSWDERDYDRSFAQSFKLILPGAIASAIICVGVGICAAHIRGGLNKFCGEFEQVQLGSDCDGIDNYTLIFHKKIKPAHIYVSALIKLVYLSLCAWLVLFFSLICRLFRGPDFRIIVYTLTEAVKEDVEITSPTGSKSITEYDEY